jgi:L-fuculose-phosphate aldolase
MADAAKSGAIIAHDKSYYQKRHDEMKLVPERGWTLPQKIALAARFLAARKHSRGLAGQITARADGNTYWTQTYGLGLNECSTSNLMRVDPNLNVIEGTGVPNPANRFHSYIYQARPAVNAIVHTHPPHMSALSMLGVPLIASHMDTIALWEDAAHLPNWPGVPFGDEEGKIISSALGDKRAILLAHHGLLTVGASVEEASTLAVLAEEAAELQLLAMAAGEIKPLPIELAREGHDKLADKQIYSRVLFDYYARQLDPAGALA